MRNCSNNNSRLFMFVLLLGFLTVLISNHSYVFAQDIGAGLVGEWLFTEGSGVVAADSSGNGNDGTLLSGRRAARCSAESQLEAGRGEREGIKKPDFDQRSAETGLVGVEFGSRHWISGWPM